MVIAPTYCQVPVGRCRRTPSSHRTLRPLIVWSSNSGRRALPCPSFRGEAARESRIGAYYITQGVFIKRVHYGVVPTVVVHVSPPPVAPVKSVIIVSSPRAAASGGA